MALAPAEQLGQMSTVTILVGPNNSGKSLALREIEAWCGGDDNPRLVVGDLDATWPSAESEIRDLIHPFETSPQPGQSPGQISIAPFGPSGDKRRTLDPSEHWILLQGGSTIHLRLSLLSVFTVRLDGRSRFELVDPKPIQDLQDPPQHHLAALYLDDDMREAVRSKVAAAFPGNYLVIDATSMTSFRIRMSDRPPADPSEEQGWNARARTFHERALPIEQLSGGVSSYTGLIAAAISLPFTALLIDEPEAFLHPPLARRLGAELARTAREKGTRLVAATHSSDFLLGCLEESPTTVVRLSYRDKIPTAHAITGEQLNEISRDPLLRSAGALRALFASSCIVCEADSDRAFNEEVNRRLAATDERQGAQDCVFLNAQNWQTIPRLAGPLRAVGVPTAVIVDLDALAEASAWAEIVQIAKLTEETRDRVLLARSAAQTAIEACGRVTTDGPLRAKLTGLDALDHQQRPPVEAALRELAEIGIFVVPAGELENWLPDLGCTNKKTWVSDMLVRMGAAGGSVYVEPRGGDVWDFVESIAAWLENPGRKGMPRPEAG